MRFTIMVMDLIFRYRMIAFSLTSVSTDAWRCEVDSIKEVADLLEALGFVSADAAEGLRCSRSSLTPQPGLTMISLTDLAALVEFACPQEGQLSSGEPEGHMLCVAGETTEEMLASAGFVMKAGYVQ